MLFQLVGAILTSLGEELYQQVSARPLGFMYGVGLGVSLRKLLQCICGMSSRGFIVCSGGLLCFAGLLVGLLHGGVSYTGVSSSASCIS